MIEYTEDTMKWYEIAMFSIFMYFLLGFWSLLLLFFLVIIYFYTKKRKKTKRRLSKTERSIVLKRQFMTCATCPNRYPLEEHHKLKISEGGYTDIVNVVLLCPNCHSAITKVQTSNSK